MIFKCFIMYYAIGMLLTIQMTWDEIARWIEEDNLSIPNAVLIVIVASVFEPIALVCGIIAGIIDILKRD